MPFLVTEADFAKVERKPYDDLEDAMNHVASKFPLSRDELNRLRSGVTVRLFIKHSIYTSIKNVDN